jgi:hypothetical protein
MVVISQLAVSALPFKTPLRLLKSFSNEKCDKDKLTRHLKQYYEESIFISEMI